MRCAHSFLIDLGSFGFLMGFLSIIVTKVFIQVLWKLDLPVSRTPDKHYYNTK